MEGNEEHSGARAVMDTIANRLFAIAGVTGVVALAQRVAVETGIDPTFIDTPRGLAELALVLAGFSGLFIKGCLGGSTQISKE